MTPEPFAAAIDATLPQTQCTRCGYPDCAAYARAVADASAGINRCPPGGAEGVARLAWLTGRPALPLDPACGAEGPLRVAVIDEAWCIGCTLCIRACPVDCIVGAAKAMHTVVETQCTGCELCLPACPVDCIVMADRSSPRTGWAAWSPAQADAARERYAFHRLRVAREAADDAARLAATAATRRADLPDRTRPTEPRATADKRAVIEAALVRSRARRGG